MAFGQLHHSAVLFSLSGGLWIVDILMRSFITNKTLSAKATALPGNVIQLTFENDSVKFKAGQYAFICIPAVNKVEFHPFSFSSCPQQGGVTLHIRELGDWTNHLGNLVREHDKVNTEDPLSLEVKLDGPYGNMQVNVDNPEYEVFVLISGGIGITPNQSIFNSLCSDVENGRKLRKVFFLWSVKDKAMINAMSPSLLTSTKGLGSDVTPLSFQPAMMGRGPLTQTATVFPKVPVDAKNEGVELDSFSSSPTASGAVVDIESSSLPLTTPPELVFEKRFYLTEVREEAHYQDGNINPDKQPWLYFGRPNISKTFDEVRTLLQASKSDGCRNKMPRVCVSVCGPPSMVQDVQELCRLSKLGCSEVTFDCHAEVFDF